MKPMRILIVNKFLYPRGGDCIYTLGLRKILEKEGHQVAFFSMHYSENLSFADSSSFAPEVSFTTSGFINKLKAIMRIFGWGVKKPFNRILDEFNPDIVHLNNIHSYLSPLVAKLAHKRNIRVVWTLHDYKLICPSYTCMYRGNPCEACFDNKLAVLTRRCFKNSYVASATASAEALCWNKDKLVKWVDAFICPSRFMADKMKSAGFPDKKITVLNNFLDNEKVEAILNIKAGREKNAYCYVGRLSEEKGVRGLLAVASTLPYTLYIAGDGPLSKELKEKYACEKIIFLGFQSTSGIISLLKKVCFSIVPSVCYENNPFSAIESLCCGTPVLGANIGGIPELITFPENGCLYKHDDESDMRRCIENMFENMEFDYEQLKNSSTRKYNEESYYQNLYALYIG